MHYTEPFLSQNRSVHGTVPYILRQKRRYIYISIDICRWTFSVHYTEPFRSRNRSVFSTTKAQIHIYQYRYMQVVFLCALYGTIPISEPFCSQNCSVNGTVPSILRQKRRYIYVSLDMCRWTFNMHYTEKFRLFYDKSADTYI